MYDTMVRLSPAEGVPQSTHFVCWSRASRDCCSRVDQLLLVLPFARWKLRGPHSEALSIPTIKEESKKQSFNYPSLYVSENLSCDMSLFLGQNYMCFPQKWLPNKFYDVRLESDGWVSPVRSQKNTNKQKTLCLDYISLFMRVSGVCGTALIFFV